MEWKYGNSWEKFPIEPGEVWTARGNNAFKGADLMCADLCSIGDGNIQRFCGEVSMVYVDPPWNQSNISSFRTKAGIKDWQSFNVFIERLARAITSVDPRVAYIEAGKQYKDFVKSRLVHHFPYVQVFNVTYYGKKPSFLIRASKDGECDPTIFEGKDDEDTPRIAMQLEKPYSIMDFCMGRGLTGRTAWECGVDRCFGIELNKRRIANLLEWYANAGLEVKRC